MAVRFLLDGAVHEIADPDPTGTVLEHLRGPMRRTGTKEGCAEGDCASPTSWERRRILRLARSASYKCPRV